VKKRGYFRICLNNSFLKMAKEKNKRNLRPETVEKGGATGKSEAAKIPRGVEIVICTP